MRVERRYTTEGQSPYAGIAFREAVSEIRNPNGSIVFRLDNVEVPEAWSQVATDIIAQKYFRKKGIPLTPKPVAEDGVPEFLWRRAAIGDGDPRTHTGETSAKQVFDRLAGAWTYWGWKGGYFDTEGDALGLRHRRPRAGSFLRGPGHRRGRPFGQRL
jgi:ribonucleoside-diphosphate reductase alpha chain